MKLKPGDTVRVVGARGTAKSVNPEKGDPVRAALRLAGQISRPGPRYILSERINDTTVAVPRKRHIITPEITSDAKEAIRSVIATGIFNMWFTRSNAVGGKATECAEAWIKPSLRATHLVNLKPSRMVR
jgi:hypothetical protein